MKTPLGTFGKKVTLLAGRSGSVMVFKANESMSYTLIIQAINTIKIGEQIRNP